LQGDHTHWDRGVYPSERLTVRPAARDRVAEGLQAAFRTCETAGAEGV
jgi:hypothetical protein